MSDIYEQPRITMPEGFDLTFNHANFKLGMPYLCWHCCEEHAPAAEAHACKGMMDGGEEVLANPYTTNLTADMFKVAARNKSYDRDKAMDYYGGVAPAYDGPDPLMAVCMSCMFQIRENDRLGWLEKCDTLDVRVKEELRTFKVTA